MPTIKETFKELALKKEGALVIGTVPGYPDLKTSFQIIEKIVSSGADILELSSSFSDPIADGPTLTAAHQKVLDSKITKSQIFDFYKKVTKNFDIPVFVIEYANIVYKIGLDNYFKEIRECGIDAVVIPDIPLEELEPFYNSSVKNKVNLALIIGPTSSDERIKRIANKSKAFVYCVLITGVTGAREAVNRETLDFIERARKLVTLPLVVGFGISQPKHIKALSRYDIDGFITCSKVITIINENTSNKQKILNELEKYIRAMRSVVHS